MSERTISTISLNVANAISSGAKFELNWFFKEAQQNQYMSFSHHNFFYSFPEFGKEWPNGKDCEFHRVHTQCNVCGLKPSRNYAGVGSLYLLKGGKRMELLCHEHVAKYKKWDPYIAPKTTNPMQLELF